MSNHGVPTGASDANALDVILGLPHHCLTPAQIQALSPVSLAYIGDAVYELYVRSRLLWPPRHSHQYHRAVVAQVKAEQQADYLHQLTPQLTDSELDLVRRGRNAAPRHRRASANRYQQATGFEALVGHLYLTNPERLAALLEGLDWIAS